MVDDSLVPVSDFGKDAYGLSGAPREAMVNYGKALLVIAGGDGTVSPAEFDWLVAHQRKFGATDDIIAEYQDFDHQSTGLDELLPAISTDVETWAAGPHLIYHAIQMSSADGDFAEGERAKIVEAARALNVADDIVLTLQALVRMEKAVYDMRAALFHVTVL
jgi:hypothetical protein